MNSAWQVMMLLLRQVGLQDLVRGGLAGEVFVTRAINLFLWWCLAQRQGLLRQEVERGLQRAASRRRDGQGARLG